MKKLLVPLIVLIVAGAAMFVAIKPSTPAAANEIKAEIQQAMQSGRTVFVQLSTTSCVICRQMKPELEKLMAENGSQKRHFTINIDADAHQALASQFAVSGVPTQVILSNDGRELFRHTGYMSYDEMKYALAKAEN